jgi:hypothetical protein
MERAMKLVLKILGGVVVAVVLAVIVLYLGWLSPPSADSVCDNMADILKNESGVDFPQKDRDDCVRRASKAPEFGRALWVAELKCIRDAKSSKELQQCGDKR